MIKSKIYSISSFMAILIARHPEQVTISGDDTAIQLGRWLRWYIRYLTITFMLWMFFSLCSGSSVGGGFTLMLYTGFLLVIVWVVQCLITTYYCEGSPCESRSSLLSLIPTWSRWGWISKSHDSIINLYFRFDTWGLYRRTAKTKLSTATLAIYTIWPTALTCTPSSRKSRPESASSSQAHLSNNQTI